MSSTTPGGKRLETEHLDAAQQALTSVTDNAVPKAGDDPAAHLHAPASKSQSNSWMRTLFPYNSLADFESAWHLGNYVIDRDTGKKNFEEMSIYVRVSSLSLASVLQRDRLQCSWACADRDAPFVLWL